jgi:hypothetical protein
MRRNIIFPGLSGFFTLIVRAIFSALVLNVVSTFLKQLFDEQEKPLEESPVQGKVIDVKAEQVLDA